MAQAPSACPVCPKCHVAMRPLDVAPGSFGVQAEGCVECADQDPRRDARPWMCPRCLRVDLVRRA